MKPGSAQHRSTASHSCRHQSLQTSWPNKQETYDKDVESQGKDKEAIYFPCLWDKPWTSSVGKFPLSAHPPPCMLRLAAAPRRENALARLILSSPAKAHAAPAHHHDTWGRPGSGALERPPTDPRGWRDHTDTGTGRTRLPGSGWMQGRERERVKEKGQFSQKILEKRKYKTINCAGRSREKVWKKTSFILLATLQVGFFLAI